MKFSIAKTAAAITIAAAAVFAVPAAATAQTSYPAEETITVPATAPGTFGANERVNVLLSGEDANQATIAVVRAAYVSNANIGSITAAANGSTAAFTINLPATASGVYSYTLVGAGGSPVTGTGNALPSTGMDSNSLLGLWVGGGALVLAGGAVAVAAAVRRQRQNADA